MKIIPTWNLSTLNANQIEIDETTFDWFPGNLTENELNSIKQNGVLLPLLVHAVEGSKYVLVDGFKRFSSLVNQNDFSALEKQMLEFPCIVLPETLSMKEVTRIRLHTLATSNTDYSAIQICKIIKRILGYGYTKDEIVRDFLPQFGLKSSVRLLNQLLDLQERLVMPEQYQQLQESEFLMSLGCEDLLPLLNFSKKDFASVISLADKMLIRGKKWRNLLQVLNEVTRLKEMSAVEILNFPEILDIFGRTNLQGQLRYRLLKQQLDSWRYPELSDLRQRFEQVRQRLKLDRRISLESDPFFENEDLTLILKVRSYKELRDHMKYLGNGATEVTTENMEKLWNDLFAVLQEY